MGQGGWDSGYFKAEWVPMTLGVAHRQSETFQTAREREAISGDVTTVGTSNVTLLTIPAQKDFNLERLIVCNTSGAAATITLHVVPSGGSVCGRE